MGFKIFLDGLARMRSSLNGDPGMACMRKNVKVDDQPQGDHHGKPIASINMYSSASTLLTECSFHCEFGHDDHRPVCFKDIPRIETDRRRIRLQHRPGMVLAHSACP